MRHLKGIFGVLVLVMLLAMIPKYAGGLLHSKDTSVVKNMKSCLDDRLPNSVGEDKIGHTYRMCWMRASKG